MADAPVREVDKWLTIVSQYENEFKKWYGRVEKILKRYRDDTRSMTNNEAAKFNILWSNVQTLIPAVYARLPKADVSRRFGDNDPVGRVASLLIERALDYEIEHYSDFRSSMYNSVSDRMLGGRGTTWVRYDPHIKQQDVQITEDVEPGENTGPDDPAEEADDGDAEVTDQTSGAVQAPPEEIDYECSPSDYVHWKDFGHSVARTWEEVQQVYRIVYMTKDALINRFGADVAEKIPLDSGPELNNRSGMKEKQGDRAKIYELWDKETRTVVWFSKSSADIIDKKPDPLGLEGFFPCPKPLFATITSDTLVPVPDFTLYQDQARELDILSDRIDGLVKALKVRGVYDASVPELQRLLTEGDNNTLIGVKNWGGFTEKGGLKGVIDLLPINELAQALLTAYEARSDIKAQIYEITGISDIIRGQTAASETATAQQIKGQYASLRLKSMQDAVAIFATEILRIKAHIICTKYQPQTILSYAAADQMTEADKALLPQAIQLIKVNPLRNFRIEVAADSLVLIDQQQEKESRMEFLAAIGPYMEKAVVAGQAVPEMAPALMHILKYAVGGFKQARTIEGTIDQAMEQLKKKAAQIAQQGPQPSPEEKVAQAQIQADAQAEQVRAHVDVQVEAARAQMEERLEMQRMHFEAAQRRAELEMEARFNRWKAELDAATKITVANINAEASTEQASMAAEREVATELKN